MDKNWMNEPRYSQSYRLGVEKFLDFAFSNHSRNGLIICPCIECKLGNYVGRNDAREHLIVKGFIRGYDDWVAHGEFSANIPTSSSSSTNYRSTPGTDDMFGLVQDAFGNFGDRSELHSPTESPKEADFTTGVAEKFYKLIDDSQKKLYDGCENFSKLSFIIRLLHIKCLGKWSNKHFDMLLKLLQEAFPEAMTVVKLLGHTQSSQVITPVPNNLPRPTLSTQHLQVGGYVILKSMFDQGTIVAQGCLYSTDPNAEVGGQELGENWCQVQVKAAFQAKEKLIRPYDHCQTIGDAIGEMVAWPCYLVTPIG